MTFGKGDHGKLGHGNTTDNKRTPTFVAALKDTPLVCIDSLSTHSVAISIDGTLYTWGNGDKHRLGHGSTAKEYVPRAVKALQDRPPVVSVACGLGHTLALLVDGRVLSWGNGSNGRLGVGDTQDRCTACPVSTLENTIVTEVFSGASHSLCVSDKGVCFSWGKNNQGQCGHGSTADILVPTTIASLSNAGCPTIQIAGGWEHTLALDAQGRLFSFGSGYKDSRRNGLPPVLGHGGHERELHPRQVVALKDMVIVHVACGWDHSLAVTDHGMLYSWGAGTNGKLGHGDEGDRSIPSQVMALSHMFVVQAEAGCEHSVAITLEGQLYTWGHGDSGRLGHGDDKTQMIPKPVCLDGADGCDANTRVVAVAVGDKYNLVLVSQDKETNESVDDSKKKKIKGSNNSIANSGKDRVAAAADTAADTASAILSATNDLLMSPEWILSLQRFSLNQSEESMTDNVPVIIAANLARLVDPILQHVVKDTQSVSTKSSETPKRTELDAGMFSPLDGLMMSKSKSGSDLHGSGRGGLEDQGPVWHVSRKAYCIEPSERAIVLFERLLRLCVKKHNRSKGKSSGHEGMNSWCIVWCILRVLRANLSQLLGDLRTTWLSKPDDGSVIRQPNEYASSRTFRGASLNGGSPSMSEPAVMPSVGSPVSPEKRRISISSSPTGSLGPEVHSPKLPQSGVSGASAKSSTERRKRRRRRDHAEFLRICASFRGIHALLMQLIELPLKTQVQSLVAQGLDETTARVVSERSAAMIVSEAADTIKMGFELFYPTATDCKILLEKCMRSTEAKPVNGVLLKAVMEKLAEENSVASLLEPLTDEVAFLPPSVYTPATDGKHK